MLPHALTEGGIPFVRSENGNGNGIPFPFVSVKKVFESFVSVETNFESSVKISFPLMALCFRVNPYTVTSMGYYIAGYIWWTATG